uniref:PDEase domain-containing protein n=1 Tax=Rodentolepis nana TaxID=102285 RepID=A0A0R3TXV8_RODNA
LAPDLSRHSRNLLVMQSMHVSRFEVQLSAFALHLLRQRIALNRKHEY